MSTIPRKGFCIYLDTFFRGRHCLFAMGKAYHAFLTRS